MTNEELAIKIQGGEKEYINTLWDNTYKLMYLIANKFYHANQEYLTSSGITLEDLEQECYFGLLDSVRYYKKKRTINSLHT